MSVYMPEHFSKIQQHVMMTQKLVPCKPQALRNHVTWKGSTDLKFYQQTL